MAAYLAACMVLAGVVGLSPVLHVLVEHDGVGTAHVHGRLPHRHAAAATQARETQGGHSEHSHPHPHPASPDQGTLLFVHSADAFPSVDVLVARWWHRFNDWLEQPASASREVPGEHHHDSLASLLVSGLIDQADTSLQSSFVCLPAKILVSPLCCRARGFVWDAQSAPRGPPVRVV